MTASGQGSPTAGGRVHDRVRITTNEQPSRRAVGSVLIATPDSVVVVDTGGVRDFTLGPELYRESVPAASIRTIEVSAGRPTGKWVLGGAAIGGLALGIVTYVGVHDRVRPRRQPPVELECQTMCSN